VNLRQALARARSSLADSSIEDPSLEGEILLRHVLGIDRARLYADLDINLSTKQEKALNELLKRRERGEPTAYITGHREFYGLDFRVDRSVLIPRPETELLVELAIKAAKQNKIKEIADIGTGCGAIAISLAINLPQVKVYATDISKAALEVARLNSLRHGVADRVVLLHGDLLEPLKQPVEMIVANLPYVRQRDLMKNASLSYEPVLALNGGASGLDRMRALCQQAREKLNKPGHLILEIGEGQAKSMKTNLRKAFPEIAIEVHKDLAGIERAVSLRLT
jgi:release factor glutamine methyltransferase